MVSRPAAPLLESLVREEWRGRPGPAREAALVSAEKDPEHRSLHLLDVSYASLVAGEPRLALRTLDEAESAGDDPEARRRVMACRVWAWQLDYNWYPGNSGAELREGALDRLKTQVNVAPGGSETRLVEACVALGPVPLLSTRDLLQRMLQQAPKAVHELLGSTLKQLQQFKNVVNESGPVGTSLWALMASADLAFRGGFVGEAFGELASVRPAYEEMRDRVGLAATFMMEGDWWAAPGTSPETLGFDLALGRPAPPANREDEARAEGAYRRAGMLLQGVDAPRATAALALRRAFLAWRATLFEQQVSWLDTAQQAFADAGDAAGGHLIVVHRLLADIARGDFGPARRAAPTEWAAAPHGPIGQIAQWAHDRGSVSFCAGLGRLLQRAGEAWIAADELERAEHALLLALPLVTQSDAIPPWTLLQMLSEVDLHRGIPERSLVRCLGALARAPAGPDTGDAKSWMEQLALTMSLVAIPTAMTPSAGSALIWALERGAVRLTTLLGAVAVDAGGAAQRPRDLAAELQEMSRRQEQLSFSDIAEQSRTGMPEVDRQFVEIGVHAGREQLAVTQALVALNRARRAERVGASAEAEQWYEETLRRARATSDETAPWLRALVLALWGRRDEALACFEQIGADGTLNIALLAPLALRVGAYETAQRLFLEMDRGATPDPSVGWLGLSDRAEAALGTIDSRRALELGRQGIAQFEAAVARLTRDSDRIAAADEVSAASLYQLTARACLALADETPDEEERREWLARSFDVGEQARSLTLRLLMHELTESGTSAESRTRRVHQAATERTTAYDQLLAAHERGDLEEIRMRETALASVEAVLADLEDEIGARPLGADAARAPVAPADAQRMLTSDACLLAYHMVGRDLVRWCVSKDAIAASHERFPRHIVEGQVNRLLRACAAGDPGDEAAALARVLIEPFDSLLASHPRVIVIPFGPLNALPFHVLPFRGQPLGATHVLSYLPAASLLTRTSLDDSLSGYGAVVVGDPAFDAQANPALRRLPGASLEAAEVGHLHAARVVLRHEEATEERLRPALRGRAVVHLAAHGHLDEIAPNTSAIVLAGADRLTVADLIGLRVDAGLAVLSACDTGRGSASLGGDVIGLVRGLLTAGVRRAVVSLWPVDDCVACVTMVAFHEELVKGTPSAQALAEAQRAVRAMSAVQLAARYRELGGEVRPGARSLRRGPDDDDGTAARPAIPLDPEFIDAGEPVDDDAGLLEGRLACAWAPFVLVGC